MRVIKVVFKDPNWKFQEIDFHMEKIVKILMTHDLATLKRLFFDLLYINVPVDLLLDRGYVEVNLCHVLAYFANEVMQHKAINLLDKLKKCNYCSEYYYFNSYKKNVCEICYVKNFQQDIGERRLKYATY